MLQLPKDMPEFEPGWVWLAGAGPGDPGLLTLHALNALSQADVLVYDALVAEEILALAPAACELRFAGKRGGKPSIKQPDITLALIDLARQGRRVLRLKGGDPFIFGRGGEEALALVRANIPFRIIPGITAGVGGLAYAGIPVTHRAINSSVTFITGHDASGAMPDTVNWRAIAQGSPVVIAYMALKHLDVLAAKFLDAGRPAEEAVAVISHACTPGQRVLVTTLGRAAEDARSAAMEAPAIIVFGQVVALRETLAWFEADGDASRRTAGD